MARQPKSQPAAQAPGFTVDTHLFRELGELLVGRDSTALAELVKNSYDADATEVTVYAERLQEGDGYVVVTDDGTGMTEGQFRRGFLRIASREKETGERRSKRFGRRFTGEKGIGRLAAHKLARQLSVRTIPSVSRGVRPVGLEVTIDWDEIERFESLDEASKAITIKRSRLAASSMSGTEIRLDHLRRRWTLEERDQFITDAQALEPPYFLVEPLPKSLLSSRLLFVRPKLRDGRRESGFRVRFAGDFEAAGEYWDAFLESAGWVLEIRATKSQVEYGIAPTRRTAKELSIPTVARRHVIDHPDQDEGPFFEARLLLRERLAESNLFRQWMRGAAGVRVFMEGFRVLPYGEWRNDWLLIDADYTARDRALRSLRGKSEFGVAVEDEGINLLPNDAWVGGVFLTDAGAPSLQTLVNREGFVPNASFDRLVSLVRLGTDLAIRERAAGRAPVRAARAQTRSASSGKETKDVPPAVRTREAFRASVERASQIGFEAREALTLGDDARAERALGKLKIELERLETELGRFVREQSILPVMASVGLQMAEFVHEVNGLLGQARAIDDSLSALRKEWTGIPELRQALAEVQQVTSDHRARLERQASYLVDVVTPAARRRRSSQRVSERFDSALRLVASAAAARHVRIINAIPHDLRTPAMFPAELTAIFANLLTNAVKAAGNGGEIRATGSERGKSIVVRVSNTGEAVQVEESERWFRPFESTTAVLDPVLGQGMGLGLPITRAILEEYGATIRFIAPRGKFATSLEIELPR